MVNLILEFSIFKFLHCRLVGDLPVKEKTLMRKVIGLFQLFLLIDSLIGSCSFGRRVGLLSESFVIHCRPLLGLILRRE